MELVQVGCCCSLAIRSGLFKREATGIKQVVNDRISGCAVGRGVPCRMDRGIIGSIIVSDDAGLTGASATGEVYKHPVVKIGGL